MVNLSLFESFVDEGCGEEGLARPEEYELEGYVDEILVQDVVS